MPHSSVAGLVLPLVIAQAGPKPVPASAEIRQNLDQLRAESVDVAAWAGRLAADWGMRILGVALILIGAWMVAAWARKTVYRALNRPQFDQTLVRFLSNALRWVVLLLGLVASLTIFGVAPASLAAVVGATGLAIGLALQGSLSNLAAGILLLLLRPFKVGDVVAVAGQTGRVDDIELFNTKIDTFDNRRIIVPNGQIFGAVIENITHHANRRVELVIGVEYAADIDATRRTLLDAISGIPGALAEPAPEVVISNLGPSSVDWRVHLWCRTADFGPVRQTTLRAVKLALDQAGIGIPFPQMEVWARSRPETSPEGPDRPAGRPGPAPLPPDWPRPSPGAAPDLD